MPVTRRPPAAAVAAAVAVLCFAALASCGGAVTDDPADRVSPSAAPSSEPGDGPATAPSGSTRTSPAPGPSGTPTPDVPTRTPATPTTPASSPTAPEPTPTPSPASPTEPTEPTEPDEPAEPVRTDLRRGDEGPAVAALQERLRALGYWLPTVDGVFGHDTHHAVVALQKAAGVARDGIVGPATEQVLAAGSRPQPRSTAGTVIEIDRAAQLLLLVTDGELRWVFDTSTGRPGLTTPGGEYRVWREIDGYRHAPLGVLYRPKYFNSGIAIHGYPSVPPYPASHGCVRVTNAAMDWFWAQDEAPIGRTVWVR